MDEKHPEQRAGIYRITCSGNGRVYVGSAKHIGRRFYLHRWELARGDHHSRLMQRAWNKYGSAAFTFEAVLLCAEVDLLRYEQIVIDFYDAANPKKGMNICSIAGRTDGVKWTDAQRARGGPTKGMRVFKDNPAAHANLMAAVHRGDKHHQFGKPRSEEVRRKISESRKGTPAWNKGQAASWAAVPRPQEVKDKASATKRAKHLERLGITAADAKAIVSANWFDKVPHQALADQYGLPKMKVLGLCNPQYGEAWLWML
ncbi:GIY-YIG nuclease family protein [Variovorax paradoxus]|nr:GIY-YIG nuclease family protein [Variovorax paradoxus]